MKVVEFFGVPKIGKSLTKYLISSKIRIKRCLSYRSIIADYLYKKKKISSYELKFLNHLEFCRENSHNKNFIIGVKIFFTNIIFFI